MLFKQKKWSGPPGVVSGNCHCGKMRNHTGLHVHGDIVSFEVPEMNREVSIGHGEEIHALDNFAMT